MILSIDGVLCPELTSAAWLPKRQTTNPILADTCVVDDIAMHVKILHTKEHSKNVDRNDLKKLFFMLALCCLTVIPHERKIFTVSKVSRLLHLTLC